MTALPLPLVLVPATQRVAALDACLASLERTLPAGARVLVADHAAGPPQVEALAQRWCAQRCLDGLGLGLRVAPVGAGQRGGDLRPR